VDVPTDTESLFCASGLIESEVNSTIDPRVVDVVGEIVERLVVERYSWNGRMREREGVTWAAAKELLRDLTSRLTRR
jgi:hypothetical protein